MFHINRKSITRAVFSFALALCFIFPGVSEAQEETTTAVAEQPVVVETQQLRKPPKEFLEHGDVVGISNGLLDKMKMKEGDELMIRTPVGDIFAFRTKIHNEYDDRIYAKKNIRETMNVEDGNLKLQLTPANWGTGPTEAITGTFSKVSRPPVIFLEYGDAVGVSTNILLQANISPGWRGTVTGPGGSRDVIVQLLDRGDDTISMRKTLRDAIGVVDGPADVSLTIHPRPEKKSDSDQNGEDTQE